MDRDNISPGSSVDYEDEYIANIKGIPLQNLFIEKLEATLEDYLRDASFHEDTLRSCMYQIAFALSSLQKKYQFTHNDLHINNIMYQSTTSVYLYYKLNNQYFRVPTFGKIFKIIDFGRAILTFKKKTYFNDVFSRTSDAGGQYSYPHQVSFLNARPPGQPIQPNYHFDLCRLAMTILEEVPKDDISETLMDFLNGLCIDSNGSNFCDMDDDFDLYIAIARNANHSLPLDTLSNEIFKDYRVSKKHFPHKSYYTL
tara:strand:+ start:113 stop:877 length:765 start_codon:yes stop_codon:yes gene_type:complete